MLCLCAVELHTSHADANLAAAAAAQPAAAAQHTAVAAAAVVVVYTCFALNNTNWRGSSARNNAWISFWNGFTASAVTAITATHSNTGTTYQTGSASDAQTIVTNMQGPTSFNNVQSGNGYWSGAYSSSNTGCGSSLSFAVHSSSVSSHCACNNPFLVIPSAWMGFLIGSCSPPSGVSAEVCVYTAP